MFYPAQPISSLSRWLLKEANRRKETDHNEDVRALIEEVVGWSKDASEHHKAACRARRMVDAERIQGMATDEGLKQAVRAAMVDLKHLLQPHGESRVPFVPRSRSHT